MPRISYNDILACLICENYRCIPWFRGSCRRGKGIPETDAGHDIPAGLPTERKATALAHAMRRFYHTHRCSCKPKTEHIFAIIGTSETRADLARFLVIRLRRKRANARRQNDRPSRACTKKPHRLRNGDAALVVAGPHKPVKRLRGTCRQAGARIPNGSDYRHSAQITSPGLGASMPGPLGNM